MTPKMQNLLQKRDELLKYMDSLEAGTDEFKEKLVEGAKLQAAIEDLAKLEELQKINDSENAVKNNTVAVSQKDKGFKLIANALKTGKIVDELGSPLKTGGLNGEDYLLPEDVKLAINQYKEELLSAKDLVTVLTTTSLSGTYNFGKNPTAGLVAFSDGDEIDSQTLPEFEQKSFKIAWYGSIIPVSNILSGAERAGLMTFINIWFTRRAVMTENKAIFDKFKSIYNSGTPKDLADYKALIKSINTEIDPIFRKSPSMVIVTNQTGYDYLDGLTDEMGRPLLQPDITQPTQMLFKGIPVKVYGNTTLPDITTNVAPVIYGSTKDAVWMHVYEDYYFDTDGGKGMGFAKNQTLLKVIEGFDVTEADKSAFIYGKINTAAGA